MPKEAARAERRPSGTAQTPAMLRGLDTKNILQNPPSMQAVIQVPSDEDPKIVTGASSGHTTRAQIHGPQPGLYDMKYHPMDEVTAPARAAQHRRLTSGLVSEDEETYDGGSDPEDAYAEDDNDDESNTAANREDGNDSDAAGISRKDVFSLKYSLRDAPKKKIYYNQKYHPQDAAIGIRHSRKRLMTRDAAGRPQSKRSRPRKSVDSPKGTLTTRRGSVHKPTPTRRDTTCTDPQSIEKQEEPELIKRPSITSLASSAKDRPLVRYTEGSAIWDTKSGERFFRHDKESHYPSTVQLHSDDPTMSDLRDDYTASWRGDPENRTKAVLDVLSTTGTGLVKPSDLCTFESEHVPPRLYGLHAELSGRDPTTSTSQRNTSTHAGIARPLSPVASGSSTSADRLLLSNEPSSKKRLNDAVPVSTSASKPRGRLNFGKQSRVTKSKKLSFRVHEDVPEQPMPTPSPDGVPLVDDFPKENVQETSGSDHSDTRDVFRVEVRTEDSARAPVDRAPRASTAGRVSTAISLEGLGDDVPSVGLRRYDQIPCVATPSGVGPNTSEVPSLFEDGVTVPNTVFHRVFVSRPSSSSASRGGLELSHPLSSNPVTADQILKSPQKDLNGAGSQTAQLNVGDLSSDDDNRSDDSDDSIDIIPARTPNVPTLTATLTRRIYPLSSPQRNDRSSEFQASMASIDRVENRPMLHMPQDKEVCDLMEDESHFANALRPTQL